MYMYVFSCREIEVTPDIYIEYVKYYWIGQKLCLIPSMSDILSQTLYHCVQYTKHHHMTLILFAIMVLYLSWLI